MNDNHQPDDDVLQLVFGELDDSRQAAVRKNVAEDAELAATVRTLTAAVAAVRTECVGQVSDDFNDRLRRRMPDIFDRTQAESAHPTFLTRSLDNWRWIMRSPVSRISAAAVFVLAITGVALWFHGGGANLAFGDFMTPILEAKSAKFKITTEIKGPPAMTTTGEVMVLDATRSRQEMKMPNRPKAVMIFDWGQGKTLTLDHASKRAMVITAVNMSKEQVAQQDIFAAFRSILLDARDKPDVKRESLGEKDIDGRRVVGFRVSSKNMVVSLWGDPKTGQPVRAEATMAMFANAKVTMSDFVFNVDMDESLFSVEAPAGYTVQNMKIDASKGQPVRGPSSPK